MSRARISRLCLIPIGLGLLGCGRKSGESTPPPTPGERPGQIQPVPSARIDTNIYLVDPDQSCLVPITVKISQSGLETQIREIVTALVTAEETETQIRCLPAGSSLRGVSIDGTTAILDFDQAFADARFWSGSGLESLRLWGIVNAVTELRKIRKVRLLVDGKPIESLGGHVELLEPLPRDESLIRDE